MSWHREVSDCGKVKSGAVIRCFDGPFGDAVVLGFNERGDMRLARPYIYASGVGTTGPTPLTGVERIEVSASQVPLYAAKLVEADGHRRV